MLAAISIIIPILNVQTALIDLLLCLFRGLEVGLVREVIIFGTGSEETTLKIPRDIGCTVLHVDKGIALQIALGLSVARSWAWILHAGNSLQTGWSIGFDVH